MFALGVGGRRYVFQLGRRIDVIMHFMVRVGWDGMGWDGLGAGLGSFV